MFLWMGVFLDSRNMRNILNNEQYNPVFIICIWQHFDYDYTYKISSSIISSVASLGFL